MSHPGEVAIGLLAIYLVIWNHVETAFRQELKPSLGGRNAAGYDMAKLFRHKFSYIAPCWYQLRRTERRYVLTGQHDVDQTWIRELRTPMHQVDPLLQRCPCFQRLHAY